MTGQLRSELVKTRTTRTLAMLVLAAAALTLLGALLEGLSPGRDQLSQESTQRELFSASSGAVFFATLAGLVAFTSEFRYGTIRPTLLFEPRRRVVLAAKLAAGAAAGVLLGALCVALAFGMGLTILAARDISVQLTGAHAFTLACGTVIASALGAMLGTAVGALIRNQVGALVAVVAYAFLIDAGLFATVPSAGRYLPGKAGDALSGLPTDGLLAPGAGAAAMIAWVLAFVVAAGLRTEWTDV